MKHEIISRFKDKPKTKTAWRAMWLGLSTLLIPPFLGTFAAIGSPMLSRNIGEKASIVAGFILGSLVLALSFSALFTSIRAFRKGERSWVLWVGFVPSILISAFWIMMVVGELIVPH